MPRRPRAADTPILPNQDAAPPSPKNEDDEDDDGDDGDDDDDRFNGVDDDEDEDEEAADSGTAALVTIDVMFSPKQNSSLIFVAGVQLQFRTE